MISTGHEPGPTERRMIEQAEQIIYELGGYLPVATKLNVTPEWLHLTLWRGGKRTQKTARLIIQAEPRLRDGLPARPERQLAARALRA